MEDCEVRTADLELSTLLAIEPGLTAIIGGGGKTTLMYTLAEELKSSGTVLICTTTGILRPLFIPVLTGAHMAELSDEFNRSPVVCAGTDAGDGKLKAPSLPVESLSQVARFVLVEADGSRGLPMKAHSACEPVIPAGASQTILVIGASGFGRTIRETAHRPELYARLAYAEEDAIITPELVARVALGENLHHRVFISQVDSAHSLAVAKELMQLLRCPVCAGSLHKKQYFQL